MYQLGPKNWKLKYIPDLPGGNQRWRAGNLPFSQQTKPPFVADFPATLETLETMVHGGIPSVDRGGLDAVFLPTGLPMNPKTCQAGISQVTSAASDRDSHAKFSAVNDH